MGLQTSCEGPFRIESRPSRSTVRIEVGLYKNGDKRYEIRHLNDLKLAHPDSLASPALRPALGRPSKQTEAQPSRNRVVAPSESDVPFPDPTSTGRVPDASGNKQVGIGPETSHATPPPEVGSPSSTANEEFQGVITGPPPAQAFSGGRPVRSTRNPNPQYVDSFWVAAAIS